MLSGCLMDDELRPQRNDDEIWVCEEIENTYFYWDKEKNAFLGIISYKGASYEFVHGESYGNCISFYSIDTLQEDVPISEETTFLIGFTDFQQGIMPVEISQDKLNIFNGEIDTLTFVLQNREEYFKSQQKTE